jgi:hypothetical protein
MPWTTDDIPDLTGRTAVITGANSGLGLESAKAPPTEGRAAGPHPTPRDDYAPSSAVRRLRWK